MLPLPRWTAAAVLAAGALLTGVLPSDPPAHAAFAQVHLTAALCGGSARRAQAGTVEAVSGHGHLEFKSPGGKWHEARKKTTLRVKDRLRTGKGERAALRACDGSTVYINQNTSVRLSGVDSVRLDKGEVEEIVTAHGTDSIKTGAAQSRPTGSTATIADVKTSRAGAAFLAALGAIQVSDPKGSVIVGAGLETVVAPNEAPKTPQPADVAAVTSWTDALPATTRPSGTTGTWQAFGAAGQFDHPASVAVDAQGDMYVADTYHAQIVKLAPNGHQITAWGTDGSDPGKLHDPQAVVVDRQGNVDVVDRGNQRVQVFSSNGDFIRQFGSGGAGHGRFNRPAALAVDARGAIYVADTGNNLIQKFGPDGSFQSQFGGTGTAPGQFQVPVGVAVDTAGYVYVADGDNWRIQKFSPAGRPLAQWGAHGNAPGQFATLLGLTLDAQGNVFVADASRVQEFSPSGVPLGRWGDAGHGVGQFDGANAVAVDAQGNIYVADTNNQRIQKYTWNRATTGQPPPPTLTPVPTTTPTATSVPSSMPTATSTAQPTATGTPVPTSTPTATSTSTPAWAGSVTLAADHTAVQVGTSVTLTATASASVTGTGDAIVISAPGNQPVTCSTGTVCTAQASATSPGSVTFSAWVQDGSGNKVASAQNVTVTWYALSISADQQTVAVGKSVTLTVSTQPDPSGSGLAVAIVVDGQQSFACNGGNPCSNQFSSTTAGAHSFTAALADSTGKVVAQSQTINVTWQGQTSTWSINLTVGSTTASGTRDLTATLNQDWSSSGYVLKLQRDNASGYVLDTCSTPQFQWGCTFTVSQQLGPNEPPGAAPSDTRTYVVTLNQAGTIGSPVATSNAVSISWGG